MVGPSADTPPHKSLPFSNTFGPDKRLAGFPTIIILRARPACIVAIAATTIATCAVDAALRYVTANIPARNAKLN
jgi:hypothetical protein